MPNIWDKPIRWIFKGDEVKSQSMVGEAKRILFQLKNIQSNGSAQYMLKKNYADGSSVNVRTDIQGLDIVNIKTSPIIPIAAEEKKEVMPLLVCVVYAYATQETHGAVHVYNMGLTSYKTTGLFEFPGLFPYVALYGGTREIEVSSKRMEAWTLNLCDAISVVDLKKVKFKENVWINPQNGWRANHSMKIDDKNGHVYIGCEGEDYYYYVYKVDMESKTVLKRVQVPSIYSYGIILGKTDYIDNTDKEHQYLYIGGTYWPVGEPGVPVYKYSLPNFELKSILYFSENFVIQNKMIVNDKTGYVYIWDGVYPNKMYKINVVTDEIISTQEWITPYKFGTFGDINTKTGEVFWNNLNAPAAQGYPTVHKWDKDMNLLAESEQLDYEYAWLGGCLMHPNGKYIYSVHTSIPPLKPGLIYRLKTDDLSINIKYTNPDNTYYQSCKILNIEEEE